MQKTTVLFENFASTNTSLNFLCPSYATRRHTARRSRQFCGGFPIFPLSLDFFYTSRTSVKRLSFLEPVQQDFLREESE